MSSNDEIVVALYDYTAKEQEELSIKKNEQLVLLDAKFTWWKVSFYFYCDLTKNSLLSARSEP